MTHPLTVTALAVLLLNDLFFKAIWPHGWVTGKLSDLAWMVFAPPLLAFLLSLVTPRNRTAERAAFVASYVGLPLLYAAFNTFAPVHDVVIRWLLLISGAAAGSPLDVTDSLVIPPAVAIAWWVWRRPTAGPSSVRTKFGLLLAGAMAVAAVASSPLPVALGVTAVAMGPDGKVTAKATYLYGRSDYYDSSDGGLTWHKFEPEEGILPSHRWVETPRGQYSIRGATIILIKPNGSRVEAYSAKHLRNDANRWVMDRTSSLGEEEAYAGFHILATGPESITYDPSTGNVIAGMGLQGVLVGTQDGRWTPVTVGVYEPADFSASAKLRLISSDVYTWLIVIVTTATFATAGLIASFTRYSAKTLVLSIGSGALFASPLLITTSADAWGYWTLFLLVALFAPVPVAVISNSVGKVLRPYVVTCSFFLLVTTWYMYFFATYIGDQANYISDGSMPLITLAFVFVPIVTLAIPYFSYIRQWHLFRVMVWGAAGVFVASAAAIFSWLLIETSIIFGVATAFIVSGLIMLTVVRRLREVRSQEERPAVQSRRLAVPGLNVVGAVVAAFLISPVIAIASVTYLSWLTWPRSTTMLGLVAGTLIAAVVAWGLVRIVALGQDFGMNARYRRRWQIVFGTALVIVGLAPTLYVWSFYFGYPIVPFLHAFSYADFIPLFVLPVLVAFGLVRYLSRLRKANDENWQDGT